MLSFCFTIITVMITNIYCAPCGGGGCYSNKQSLRSSSVPEPLPNDNLISVDKNVPILPPKRRRKCCPYDFDSRLCQVVGDRVLCGFNRNLGRPGYNDDSRELGGGCRIRGGRLECGYDGEGPFVNQRRPPAWSNNHSEDTLSHEPDSTKEKDYKNDAESKPVDKLKYILPSTKKPTGDVVTKCVEVKERIVCKE